MSKIDDLSQAWVLIFSVPNQHFDDFGYSDDGNSNDLRAITDHILHNKSRGLSTGNIKLDQKKT